MAAEEAWGQLLYLCTTETKSPIRLIKKTIKIGRTRDSDISFPSNKLISAKHCHISCGDDGKMWLTDISTNGTFINGIKVKKGVNVQISHNDQIQLVQRKDHPEHDIAYMFQDLKCLKEVSILESTQEYEDDDTTETEEEVPDVKLAKRPLVDASDEMQPESKKQKKDADAEGTNEKSKSHSRDTMGESLVCSICQDIFHDCLSLQPCMHSFCTSCYSQWMERSRECPTCRLPVKRMSRHHIVNNLVEAYLLKNPEKRRPAEELAEMDARNKITEDMVKPKKHTRELLDDDTDLDTSESEEEPQEHSEFMFIGTGVLTRASSWSRPLTSVCRWCPGYRPPTTVVSTASNTSAGDSSLVTSSQTNSSDVTAGVPQPVCPVGMVHLSCLCCSKPMPRQEDLPQSQSGVPYAKSQKCSLCLIFYCHLLWKCDKPGCRGCLNEFKDLDFSEDCLDILIMDNKYESQVLKSYLNEKGWSLKDLLRKCLEKFDAREYNTPDGMSRPSFNSKVALCFRCGLKNFKELAYQFRKDIPREELPAAVTSRPDCYWGKSCRTQRNPSNPHHASRYNHICEQTRFS